MLEDLPGFCDAHCHLDAFADPMKTLDAAARLGLRSLVVPGVFDREMWNRLRGYTGPIELYWALGLHPYQVPRLASSTDVLQVALDELARDIAELRPHAIGECGLDGALAKRGLSMGSQEEVLLYHLRLAEEHQLPMILHVHDAHGRALEFFKRHGRPKRGGMVHSYSGSLELVREWTAMGFLISLGPSLTRAKARRPKQIAEMIALESLLLETDSPDQYLDGSPDRTGSPEDMAHIYGQVAALRTEPIDTLKASMFSNLTRLFGSERPRAEDLSEVVRAE